MAQKVKKPCAAAPTGYESILCLAVHELCRRGCDAKMTSTYDFATAANCLSVDSSHYGSGAGPQTIEESLHPSRHLNAFFTRVQRCEVFKVASRAKGLRAGTSDDQSANLRISLDVIENCFQRVHHRLVNCIVNVGSVQTNNSNCVCWLKGDTFICKVFMHLPTQVGSTCEKRTEVLRTGTY